ncbi:hypothetical protein [Hydrogenimonas sp.]
MGAILGISENMPLKESDVFGYIHLSMCVPSVNRLRYPDYEIFALYRSYKSLQRETPPWNKNSNNKQLMLPRKRALQSRQ